MTFSLETAVKAVAFAAVFGLSAVSISGNAEASEHCKNVRIQISNQSGTTVQIYDIDYFDYSSGRWRSEATKNRIVNDGGSWEYKKRLEKVGAEQTQIRIQYRTARNGKWKDKHASVSAPAVCYNGSTYRIALR